MPFNPDGSFSLVQQFGTGTPLDNPFPNKVGGNLDDIATALGSTSTNNPYLVKSNNLSDIPSAPTARTNIGAAGLTQTDFITGGIQTPFNQDYRIIEKIPFGATLTSFTAKSSAGTLTATLKINSTAVTNGAINVTSSQASVSPSALNVLVSGDALVLTISATSGVANLSFTIVYTEALV